MVAVVLLASCDNESLKKNPGDFNLKSELTLGTFSTYNNATTIPLNIIETSDTVYKHSYTKNDTVKDAQGKPVIGEDGNLVIHKDTLFSLSKIKAKHIKMQAIVLPPQADTFKIKITSNARWFAPVPDTKGKAQWFFNYNSTTTGGGNATYAFRVLRNRGRKRINTSIQEIFTSDSTIIYTIPFEQKGERDK